MVGAEIWTDDLALEISYWGDIPKSRVKNVCREVFKAKVTLESAFGNLMPLAAVPLRLTVARVAGNNLPPPRLKPDVPLPSHRPHSLWFRKTTRLTDVQIRLFAGRLPKLGSQPF